MNKFLILLFFTTNIFATNLSQSQYLNIATKQRMLSQQMSKVYMLNAYGAHLSSADQELELCKTQFIENIRLLNKSSSSFSKDVKEAVQNQKNVWSSYQSFFNNEEYRESPKKILVFSDQLLTATNLLIEAIRYEKVKKKYEKHKYLLLNVENSGKLRMLSQRLCMYYISKKIDALTNHQYYKNQNILVSTFEKLEKSLNLLHNDINNDLSVNNAIGKAMSTFKSLKDFKEDFMNGTVSLNMVCNITNQLTEDCNHIAYLYAKKYESLTK